MASPRACRDARAIAGPISKLFWCSTEDHANDWGVVARDAEEAGRFFATEEGYRLSQVHTDLVVVLPRVRQTDVAKWPTLELIASVGCAFVHGEVPATRVALGCRCCDPGDGRELVGLDIVDDD
jgi:hypothetical protein